jgi:hypothetical protein
MQPRLKRLKRIAALYEVVERMHSVELQRARIVVREAKQAIETQQMIVHAAGFDGREALVRGDRMGWALAETQQVVAAWKGARLEEIRVKREELSEVARDRYVASRLKNEQMNWVVEGFVACVEKEEGRRFQTTTDDRFLSRKLWMETREEARSKQMKTS